MFKNQVFNNFRTPSSTQTTVQLIVNKLVSYFGEWIDTVTDTVKINNRIPGLRKKIFIILGIRSSTQIKKALKKFKAFFIFTLCKLPELYLLAAKA